MLGLLKGCCGGHASRPFSTVYVLWPPYPAFGYRETLKARLVSLDEGLNVFALPDNCPNQGEPPADERPAEEQIDEEDGRSPLVLPDVGDHGGHEVDRHHRGEGDDQDGIESRVVRQVKIHK